MATARRGGARSSTSCTRLLKIHNASNILVEKILFKQPPYWTTLFDDVDGVTIRHSNISVHRTNATTHDIVELQAFNTDGFDVAGRNVHIHDVQIWNCLLYTSPSPRD